MANIKFSAFTTETDDTQIDFLAGYQGTTMKKIAPNNITGAYPLKLKQILYILVLFQDHCLVLLKVTQY